MGRGPRHHRVETYDTTRKTTTTETGKELCVLFFSLFPLLFTNCFAYMFVPPFDVLKEQKRKRYKKSTSHVATATTTTTKTTTIATTTTPTRNQLCRMIQ